MKRKLKPIKVFLLMVAALLAIACESEKTTSFMKGNPYGKDFAGLNGPVKYVVYSTYRNGIVSKATRNDYSPEGVLVKSKTFENGDSIVYHYIYDPSNNIQEISGSGISNYKAQYQKGTLVKEWVYNDEKKKTGITKRYQIKGETFIKKVNDIKTRTGTTYTYAYNSKGILLAQQTMVNDGAYWQYIYDEKERLIGINYYNSKGKLKYKEKISCKYDSYNNCTQYVSRRKGKVIEKVKMTYQYYTEDELKNAKQKVESSKISFSSNSLLKHTDYEDISAPSNGLMTAIIILSVFFFFLYLYYAHRHWGLFRNFGGKVEYNGMRKMWMYNSEPYIKMCIIFATILGSFLSSIIVLLLCGGVIWLIFWAVNLLLWGVVILGWVLLIGGIIAFLFKHLYGIIAAILGGIIVFYSDQLTKWGQQIVDWGASFLDHLNAIDWTISIFYTYGKTALMVSATPIIAFLTLAILLIIFSYLLRAMEFAASKIYNVNRPCPFCGNKKKFIYMVNGKEYPIDLRPGRYGIFYQTNHYTKDKVPTMLMNGKSKLTRKCPHCSQLSNTAHDKAYGTDIHIGIVGERSSGKSYLLYSGLELLTQKWGKDLQQIDVDYNNKVEVVAQRIHHQDGIQTASKNRYKAIQFRLKLKLRPMPYQLYFYDVAGEKFNAKATKTPSALEFYTNVKTIVFIIDPSMLNIEKVSPSRAFEMWHKKHGNPYEEYDPEATISTLKDIVEQVGKKTKDIDLIMTCTKKDLGYLQNSNYPYSAKEEDIKKFIKEELGLFNLDNAVNSWFKSVSYAAVSTTDEDRTALSSLFQHILKQRGIHMD